MYYGCQSIENKTYKRAQVKSKLLPVPVCLKYHCNTIAGMQAKAQLYFKNIRIKKETKPGFLFCLSA